jgi:hypothetical protein
VYARRQWRGGVLRDAAAADAGCCPTRAGEQTGTAALQGGPAASYIPHDAKVAFAPAISSWIR